MTKTDPIINRLEKYDSLDEICVDTLESILMETDIDNDGILLDLGRLLIELSKSRRYLKRHIKNKDWGQCLNISYEIEYFHQSFIDGIKMIIKMREKGMRL